jgi:hypothetical protein
MYVLYRGFPMFISGFSEVYLHKDSPIFILHGDSQIFTVYINFLFFIFTNTMGNSKVKSGHDHPKKYTY